MGRTQNSYTEDLVIPELEKWDIRKETVHPNGIWAKELPSVLIIGPSKGGKSTCYFEICFQTRDQFVAGVAFVSSHLPGGAPYAQLFHEVYIYKTVNDRRLERIEHRQEKIIEKYNNGEIEGNFNPQIHVVFDDIINRVTKYIPLLTDMFTRWRHVFIFVVMLIHGSKFLLPDMINNAQHAYFSATDKEKEITHIFNTFHSCFNNKVLHRVSFQYYTSDFGFIVSKKGIGLENCVFSLRVPVRDPNKLFRMGSNEYWYLGELMYQKKIQKIQDEIKIFRVSREEKEKEKEKIRQFEEQLLNNNTQSAPKKPRPPPRINSQTFSPSSLPPPPPPPPLRTSHERDILSLGNQKLITVGKKTLRIVPPKVGFVKFDEVKPPPPPPPN